MRISKLENSIRVLVADDHPVVRSGLRALIETEPGIVVVGDAANGDEAVEKTAQLKPDVVLLDLIMPGASGVEAIKGIRRQNPDSHVLVLTSFAQDDLLFPAIKAGALGYLLKDSSPEELFQAIRRVNAGESSLHPTIARKLLQEFADPSADKVPVDPLTHRENEVLGLLASGHSNQEIADLLSISERTVGKHVSNILDQIDFVGRRRAVFGALALTPSGSGRTEQRVLVLVKEVPQVDGQMLG